MHQVCCKEKECIDIWACLLMNPFERLFCLCWLCICLSFPCWHLFSDHADTDKKTFKQEQTGGGQTFFVPSSEHWSWDNDKGHDPSRSPQQIFVCWSGLCWLVVRFWSTLARSSAHWSQRSENPLRLWQKRGLSCFYEGNRLRAALRFSMVSAVRFDYWNTTVDSTEMSHLIRMLKLIKPQGHPSRTMWQLPLYQAALLLVLYARNTQFLVLSWQPSEEL